MREDLNTQTRKRWRKCVRRVTGWREEKRTREADSVRPTQRKRNGKSRGLFTFYSLTQTHWTPTLSPEALHLTFLLLNPPMLLPRASQSRRCTKQEKYTTTDPDYSPQSSVRACTHTHTHTERERERERQREREREPTGCFLFSKWVSVSGIRPHFRQTLVYFFLRSNIPGWHFTDIRGLQK